MRLMRIGLIVGVVGLALASAAAPAAAQRPLAAALGERVSATAPDTVTRFYAARGHDPLWLDGEGRAGTRAAALVEALQAADAHALPPARYDAEGLAAALDATGPRPAAEAAALDLALTRAYLDYARDLSSGLLTPRRVDRDLDLEPIRPEPEALLARMAASADPRGLLDSLAPAHPDYAALRDRLAAYRALAAGEGWSAPVPQGTTLREGDRSARVATLRRRLEAMGDLAPAADAAADDLKLAANDVITDAASATAGDPAYFDARLTAAVAHFQARHGLNTDGLVGPATLRALNRSPGYRARQIAANLERLRWLNKPLGDRHVMVNLAGFRMALVDDGVETFESRVVIGKTGSRPPSSPTRWSSWWSTRPGTCRPRSSQRDPAEAARGPDLSEAPEHGADRRRRGPRDDRLGVHHPLDLSRPRQAAPGAEQRARPGEVQVPEPSRDLPARHAAEVAVPARPAGLFAWLRAGDEALRVRPPPAGAPARRPRGDVQPLARARDGDLRASRRPGAGAHHLSHRPRGGDGSDQFRGDVYGRDRRIARGAGGKGVRLPPA